MLPRSSAEDLPEDAPLVAVRRGDLIESFHRGRVAVCDPDGELLDATGDPDARICLRSSAKPFQALPLVLYGAADALHLTDEEVAVACSSHNGEQRHLETVRSLLQKAGLSEDDLQSGPHPPLYPPAARELARDGALPRSIHSNCSGKHAGMLAVCVHRGWEKESYRDPDHPLQRRIRELIALVCGLEKGEVLLAGDNCGVPAFIVPLRGLATGFARLATGKGLPEDVARAAGRIREAMREHPFLLAGTGRFDTELMQSTSLVAKSGAEAVFAAGSSEGWGMAVKISDGAGRAVRPAVLALLYRRGVVVPGARESSPLRDLHGRVVGRTAPLRPAE